MSSNLENGSGDQYGMDSPTRESYLKEFDTMGSGISTTNNNIEPRDPDNEPMHSRIFVVCGKTAPDSKLHEVFSKCGKIEYVKLVKDKATNESKGVAYVKYSKASSAAIAIETLNGKPLPGDDATPMKVMIADAKGDRTHSSKSASKEPEDNPPRSRLFIICSKETTEDELTSRFKQFGDFEYCKLMKDRTTGESKGCAYVKFSKSSTATIAMESVNDSVSENSDGEGTKLKALIAHPKTKRSTEYGRPDHNHGYPSHGSSGNRMGYSPYGVGVGGGYGDYSYMQMSQYQHQPYQSRQRLFIVHNKSVTHEQLSRLFGRYPGMEYCDVKRDKQTNEPKGFSYINYSTPQAAMMAKEQLDGIDFPSGSGSSLKVFYAEPLGVNKNQRDRGVGNNQNNSNLSGNSGLGNMNMTGHENTTANGEPLSFSSMRDNFAQMMSYPPNQGNQRGPQYGGRQGSDGGIDKSSIDPPGSRLFVSYIGKVLPEYVLQDVFQQFPGLEYVKIHKEKKYGYVKYTTPVSAQYALSYLEGADIGGTKLKIQVAQPPESRNKRQKT